jgi:hypothetical protein
VTNDHVKHLTSDERWYHQWDELVESGVYTMGVYTIGNSTNDLVQHLTSSERHELVESGVYTVGNSIVLDSTHQPADQSVVGIHGEMRTQWQKPGLSDNGASLRSSCAKTLDGAVLSTFCGSDSGRLDVGEDGAALVSRGSYVYMLERSGKNHVTELVLRRMKHTPNLKLHYVATVPG